jgi:hypothetical protein
MKIYRIAQVPQDTGRKHGLTLPETGYNERYVYIYRAVPKTVTTFNYMDYVTRSKKFAKEHADHMMWTTEEDQHVLSAMIKSEDVAEASNPGEYFYIGKTPANGRAIYEAKYELV